MQTTISTRGLWKLLMLVPVLGFLFSSTVHAQYFQLYGVDGSKFPFMSAQFVAQDAAGNDYPDIKKGDFDITENGQSVYSDATFGCRDTTIPPAANVVLVLDRSGSMETIVDTATKKTRMDWVISGATAFLNTFKFVPPSKVAVISFGTIPTFESPFRNTAAPLVNVISKLKPQGGTEYNPPMLDTSFGAIKLLSGEAPTVRRIVIFLTDGQPDHDPSRDSMIKLCNQYAIQFYAITIGTKMNDDLRRVAEATGGKWFEAKTEDDLVAIYRLIALQTEIKKLCTVTWMAPFSCNQSGRDRTVSVLFKRPNTAVKSEIKYLAPANSVASVILSSSTLYFGDPAPNASTTQKFTIKPVNSPLKITCLNTSPPGFFVVTDIGGGKSLPLTVNPGDSIVITVQFTQGSSKGYRQASLIVCGTPCPPIIPMFGGLSSVQVISPSDEIDNTCDPIAIRWAGVDPSQGVNIFVRDESLPNPTWILIKQNATGLVYYWKPTLVGKKLRVRITASPPPTYLWTRSIGGPMIDTTRSIAMDASQLYVNVAGTMSDTVHVTGSSMTAPSQGARDCFVARFNTNGDLIWIESAGGSGDEGNCGVATDSKGGIYVAGYFTSKAFQFGQTFINMQPRDAVNMYVAKYNPDGSVQWVRTGGGTATNNGYAYCDSIGVSGDSIYVYGHYKTCLGIVGYSGAYISTTSTNLQKFTAVFDLSGNPLSLTATYMPNKKYTTSSVSDSKGNLFDCGSFKGTQNNGGASVNLTSRGDFDCFVREFGGQPGSSDSSHMNFAVSAPVISFKTPILTLPTISVGLSSNQTFTAQLCNTGDIPILIPPGAITLSGANPGDFKVNTSYDGQLFYPGECHDIEISFQPTVEGTRTATLTLGTSCGTPAIVELQAVALPPCKFESAQPYIGAQSINLMKPASAPCIIRNNSASDYQGWIEMVGLNPDEFKVTFPDMNAPNVLDNVNNHVDFKLKANKECLRADIEFTPKGAGQRTAVLRFHIPVECGSQQEIALIGFGLAPKVDVDSVPFGMRRIKTNKTLQCTIRNNDTLDARLTSIALANTDVNFRLINPPANYLLKKKDSLKVDVEFSPQSTGYLSNYVNVIVDGSSTPIQGLVSGTGFLPSIEALDVTFPPCPANTPALQQTMRVRNTNHNAPLHVKSISAATNAQFVVSGIPADFILAPDSSRDFAVNLTPLPGANVGFVHIVSDAMEGPLEDPDIIDTVKLSGEGLQVDIDPQPSSFGDVLSCDSVEKRTITIRNNSTNTINVQVSMTGDSSAFDVFPAPGSMDLSTGGSKTYTVTCKGHPGAKSIRLSFTLPSGTVTRDFSSNGITATMNVNSGVGSGNGPDYRAGSQLQWGTQFVIPSLTNVVVDKLGLIVRFDSSLVVFDTASFMKSIGGWTWKYDAIFATSGTWTMHGTHPTGVNGGTVSCSIPLKILNPTVDRIPVNVIWTDSTFYPCITSQVSNKSIGVIKGCYSNGSQLTGTKASFGLVVSPNPISGSQMNVDFGVAYDIPFSVEMFNTVGERVAVVGEGNSAGNYQSTTDVSALATGVYYLRLIAGDTIETRVVTIGR